MSFLVQISDPNFLDKFTKAELGEIVKANCRLAGYFLPIENPSSLVPVGEFLTCNEETFLEGINQYVKVSSEPNAKMKNTVKLKKIVIEQGRRMQESMFNDVNFISEDLIKMAIITKNEGVIPEIREKLRMFQIYFDQVTTRVRSSFPSNESKLTPPIEERKAAPLIGDEEVEIKQDIVQLNVHIEDEFMDGD